jgi:hypothetical protein
VNSVRESAGIRSRRHLGVTVYFLLMGPLVVYGLGVADALGAQFSGMSPTGSARGRDPNLMWGVGVYCVLGAMAGGITSRWMRVFLTCAAHVTVIVAEMQTPLTRGGGAVNGTILCGMLAIPFGLAWLILVADGIWRRTRTANS